MAGREGLDTTDPPPRGVWTAFTRSDAPKPGEDTGVLLAGSAAAMIDGDVRAPAVAGSGLTTAVARRAAPAPFLTRGNGGRLSITLELDALAIGRTNKSFPSPTGGEGVEEAEAEAGKPFAWLLSEAIGLFVADVVVLLSSAAPSFSFIPCRLLRNC